MNPNIDTLRESVASYLGDYHPSNDWTKGDPIYNGQLNSAWQSMDRLSKSNQFIITKLLYVVRRMETRQIKIEKEIGEVKNLISNPVTNIDSLSKKLDGLSIGTSRRSSSTPEFGLIRQPGVSWIMANQRNTS